MRLFFAALLMVMPLAAHAGSVVLTEKTLQKGVWEDAACKQAEVESGAGNPYVTSMKCLCIADIAYVELSDLPNAEAINAVILEKAREGQKGIGENGDAPACLGREITDSSSIDKTGATEYSFVVTKSFESDDILVLTLETSGYGEGAAHGFGWTDGMVIDTRAGKILNSEDLIDVSNYGAVNQYIFETLKTMPDSFLGSCEEGDEFSQCKKEAPAYLNEGKRGIGSLMVDKRGLYMLFSPYAVGPYSSGNIDVPIPEKFVKNSAIKKLYGAK